MIVLDGSWRSRLDVRLGRQLEFCRRIFSSDIGLAPFGVGSLPAVDLLNSGLAAHEIEPVVMRHVDFMGHEGAVLVFVANDGVGSITFDDFVVLVFISSEILERTGLLTVNQS